MKYGLGILIFVGAIGSANAEDRELTALVQAVKKGDLDRVDTLLRSGVNPNGFYLRRSLLMWAAMSGDPEAARRLLAKGADPTAANENGETALHYATRGSGEPNRDAMVKLLVEAGASVNAGTTGGRTALHSAARDNRHRALEYLLSKGGDPKLEAGNPSDTVLLVAAHHGALEAVEVLVRHGVPVDSRNKIGDTPLIRAVAKGHLRVVEWLLDAGAKVDALGRYSGTALRTAIGLRRAVIVKLLLERGADPGFVGPDEWPWEGGTPLMVAAKEGDLGIVELILQHGVDLAVRDKEDRTALAHALVRGHGPVVELLVERGAQPDPSAMFSAAAGGSVEAGRLLLARGFDADSAAGSKTPLMVAATNGHAEFLEFLLDAGADVNAALAGPTFAGHTAMTAATIHREPACIKVLANHGADPNVRFVDTPLSIAAEVGDLDLVKLLLTKGADPYTTGGDGKLPHKLAEEGGHTAIADLLRSHTAGLSARQLNNRGMEQYRVKNYTGAERLFRLAIRRNRGHRLASYNLACVMALQLAEDEPIDPCDEQERVGNILDQLQQALELDARVATKAAKDDDFASIRCFPAFWLLLGRDFSTTKVVKYVLDGTWSGESDGVLGGPGITFSYGTDFSLAWIQGYARDGTPKWIKRSGTFRVTRNGTIVLRFNGGKVVKTSIDEHGVMRVMDLVFAYGPECGV